VVAARQISLAGRDRNEVSQLASELSRENRNLTNNAYFAASARSGFGPSSSILIGDKSEIPLLAPAGEDILEYRIALLANADDLIVLAGDRNPAFESYLGNLLGLETLQVLHARQPANGPSLATARRCVEDPVLSGRLADHVRTHRGATLLPHISTGSVWALAKLLHERTQEKIFVAAPPPNLASRVNDKIWFADIAIRLLGAEAVPPCVSAFGPAALTGHVRRLVQSYEKIVVKIPNSAGSAGNFPIRSAAVRGLGAKALRNYLMNLISATGWSNTYPLMVEVWDCNVLSSPSVQMWIPDPDDGDPVIEGVFDQVLTGEEGRFVGAGSADLLPDWDTKLCRDAMKLALLFQNLGYFGRCSFDSVIAGDDYANATLHWIECNGRWGGVSLPMTFMNRLFSPDTQPAYIVVQRADLAFKANPFEEAVRNLGALVYRPDGPPEGIVFLAPKGIETGQSLQMISIGVTPDDAMRRVDHVIACLCGFRGNPP